MQLSGFIIAFLASNVSQVLSQPIDTGYNAVATPEHVVPEAAEAGFNRLSERGSGKSKAVKVSSDKDQKKAKDKEAKYEAKYIGECMNRCNSDFAECKSMNPKNWGGCMRRHSICVTNCHNNQDIY